MTRPNYSRRRGQVLLLMVSLVAILLGAVGMSIDLVWAYIVRSRLAGAVDAAAVAAANAAPDGPYAQAAAETFDINIPERWSMALSRSHAEPAVTAGPSGETIVTVSASALSPTYFMNAFGYSALPVNVRATAIKPPAARWELLLLDEDAISATAATIQQISNSLPNCGGADPAKCVNADIASPGLRTQLFSRGGPVTPLAGFTLSAGTDADPGIFRLAGADPQVSSRTAASFTSYELFMATGDASSPTNLDRIPGVQALDSLAVQQLANKTFCAIVVQGDLAYDPATGEANLAGATLGQTVFQVTAAASALSTALPNLTVNLLDHAAIESICAESTMQAGGPSRAGGAYLSYSAGAEAPGAIDR